MLTINRLLIILGGIALASLLLAGAAIFTQQNTRTPSPAALFLPNLAEHLERATRLTITYGRGLAGVGTLTFTRGGDGGSDGGRDGDPSWYMHLHAHTDSADTITYRANQELVLETLLALADLRVIAPRTALAERHIDLGLIAPEKLGAATHFRVQDGAGNLLVSVLLGQDQTSDNDARSNTLSRTQRIGRARRNFYMRTAEDAQSWLIAGRLPRNYAIAAWIDPYLPHHLQATPPQSIMFHTPSAPTTLAPDKITATMPALLALRPDNVVPHDTLQFTPRTPRLTLVYENGLIITYHVLAAATHIWVRPDIGVGANAPAHIADEATQLQARYGAWAWRFAADAAPVLLPRFDD